MEKDEFTVFAVRYIEKLRDEGRHSTAHVYRSALSSFIRFCGSPFIAFSQINRENLKRYSQYLSGLRLHLNTISTYMRMLRSIYNQGVSSGCAVYVQWLFHEVFTGVDTRQKKALPASELYTLLYKDPQSDSLRNTQAVANLLFQFSGMPFADFAHLEKSNLKNGILTYNRIKTGTSVSVEVLDTASEAMSLLRNDTSLPSSPFSSSFDFPDYLFRVLSGQYKRGEVAAYIEYQSVLRRFNNQLKRLAKKLHIHSPVTSYTFRHSWATTAKYLGIPIEMISESLGHTSIRTTQIYLKGFELEERTKVNKQNYFYVRNYGKRKNN